MNQDRNFDSLIERFAQQIYHTAKGAWRLKLLQEDLRFLHDRQAPLAVWDAGCGFAQLSFWLAQQGHQVTLCDVSEKMLTQARQLFAEAGLSAAFIHQSAQTLAPKLPEFDLVLCHAVLEWLAQPLPSLEIIAGKVKPGGYLSLMFYNRNAMIYANTLKGSWRLRHLLSGEYLGKGKRLTPPNPQYPQEVIEILEQQGFTVTAHTGIRVFHDYLSKPVLAETDQDELFELEYRHCRMPTFRDMGRYVHLLAQRPV